MLNLKEAWNGKSKIIEKKMESNIQIEQIEIDLIRPNPYQPRKVFTEHNLNELSESIRYYGVLQPIQVRRINNNSYELIAGERRLRASKQAGLTHIPAIIKNAFEQDSAMISLMENLQREDLSYMEEAEGYYNLIKDHGFTQDDLSKKIGKSQSTIANKLRLLKLPPSIKQLLINENLTERHARALLRIYDEDAQHKIICQVISRNLNVKYTEELIEKYLQKTCKDEKNREQIGVKDNQEIMKPKITKLYKDYRLFINTMKNAVKSMKEVGINAQYQQEEKEDQIEIHVVIPKY